MRFFVVLLVLFLTAPLNAALITDGLVGYWKFENSIEDSSGRGHTGTIQNGATYEAVESYLGTSIHFDGINDYVRVATHTDFDFTDEYTALVWINPDRVNISYQTFFSKWIPSDVNNRAINLQLNYDKVFEGISTNTSATTGPIISTDETVNAGQWYHLGFTFDRTYVRIYINGVLVEEISGSYPQIHYSAADLIFGSYNASGRYYKGYLDEMMLFDRALTTTEIFNEYDFVLNGSFTPVPEPMTILTILMGLFGIFLKKR